jgi:CRP-like cAMP-binding protein
MAGIELFAACSPRERRTLSRLCTTVDVRAGRVLCRQGQLGEECFVVVDGRADVFIDDARVASIGAGEAFGELALFSRNAARAATVVAATDMQLLVLNRREFKALAEGWPSVRERLLRAATRRLLENAERR